LFDLTLYFEKKYMFFLKIIGKPRFLDETIEIMLLKEI